MILNGKFRDINTLERVLLEIPSCIFFKDTECRYVFATHYWKHLNVDDDDENWTIVGKTDLDIRKDKANAMKAMEADRRIIETGQSEDYIICEETDGVIEYLQLIKRPVRDEDGTIIGIVGLINDVTKQVMLEKQLNTYMDALKIESETDPLTQICNRRSGQHFVDSRKTPGAFCLFDVDKFKVINDTFGHGVGDEVLIEIANIMKKSFRSSDTIMRLGGDEFAVFAAGVDNVTIARLVIDRFFERLGEMHLTSLGTHKVTISMGVYFADADDSFETMYKHADEIMYKQKKERGGNGYDFFEIPVKL